MREINITANDAGRRLDRFLRRYLPGSSLGEIYKIIRKDVKVGGKRAGESYILNEGDVLSLYLSDDAFERARGGASGASGMRASGSGKARRSFGIVYEDDNILIADKPCGLLTHGDSHEKKNHLANQVKDHLIETGAYDPRSEKVFSPAPVNRLDRNTTGIVLFGKTSEALRELTRLIREGGVSKFYLTIACGVIDRELRLSGSLVKDEAKNRVRVTDSDDAPENARAIETIVRPLKLLEYAGGLKATFCEVELVTGRSHQIRAHLASAGHPLIGDAKYSDAGSAALNRYMKDRFGLSTQLLHAGRIEFAESAAETGSLPYLAGQAFSCPLPKRFSDILEASRNK